MAWKDKLILKIRQPAKWNRYVDPSIPLTWRKRWQEVRTALPILCITVFLFLEMTLLRAFFDGVEVGRDKLLVLFLVFPLFITLFLEAAIRGSHWMPRTLILRRKGLTWEHHKVLSWGWRPVKAFEFADIPGSGGAKKVCLRIVTRKGVTIRKCLVLAESSQVSELETALRQRDNFDGADYEVLEHDAKAVKPRLRLLPIWCWALGFFFLVHGLPLLGLALTKGGSEETPEQKQASEERPVNPVVRDWVIRNVKTEEQLARIFLISGITFTAAAVGCFFAAGRMRLVEKKMENGLLDHAAPPDHLIANQNR